MSATPGGGAGSARRSSRPPDVPDTLVHELTRLRNELKVKDAAIEVSQPLQTRIVSCDRAVAG
jgi:hypothetical protein